MSYTHNENLGQNSTNGTSFLAADPSTAIQEMMETIDELRTVYVSETEALNTANTQAFFDIQDRKLIAARNYQAGIEELIRRRDEMKDLSPAMKQQLEDMQKEFSTLAKQNLDALQRMQRSVERLGNTLRNAAKEAARKDRALSYGESGKIDTDDKRLVSTGISETA